MRLKSNCNHVNTSTKCSFKTMKASTKIDKYKARTTSEFHLQYKGPCGPGSVVGIATGYGLDGPGIESR